MNEGRPNLGNLELWCGLIRTTNFEEMDIPILWWNPSVSTRYASWKLFPSHPEEFRVSFNLPFSDCFLTSWQCLLNCVVRSTESKFTHLETESPILITSLIAVILIPYHKAYCRFLGSRLVQLPSHCFWTNFTVRSMRFHGSCVDC